MTKMMAMVQDRYGSSDVVQLSQIERPQPTGKEVLVRVRAAGVNPADWALMRGLPFIARPTPLYGLRRPTHQVRGTDVAGVVEAVGTGVTRFKPGDEVFGWSTGSFAEFAAAAEDALALRPANLTFEEAAVVPMAGSVALLALRDHVHAGDKILVNGASGGVGTFAVQIAKALGAEVTAVCSTGNVDMVRAIGADHVIDYTREDFTQAGRRYDLILDNVGNHSLSDLKGALTPKGTLAPNSGNFENHWFASAGRLLRAFVSFRFASQKLRTFIVHPNREALDYLKGMIEAGTVTSVLDRTFAFNEVARALDYVGHGHVRGKVAVTVIGSSIPS